MNNKTAPIRTALKEYLGLGGSAPAKGLLRGGGRERVALLWLCPGQLNVTWEPGHLNLHFFSY